MITWITLFTVNTHKGTKCKSLIDATKINDQILKHFVFSRSYFFLSRLTMRITAFCCDNLVRLGSYRSDLELSNTILRPPLLHVSDEIF